MEGKELLTIWVKTLHQNREWREEIVSYKEVRGRVRQYNR